MARLLREPAKSGVEVRNWYVGLESVELHIERVRSKVARGRHGIPKGKIRERYDYSRWNLIDLLPSLAELKIFDNMTESNPPCLQQGKLRQGGRPSQPEREDHPRGLAN